MFRRIVLAATAFLALSLPLPGLAGLTEGPAVAGLSPNAQHCIGQMRTAVDQYLGTYSGTPPKSVKVVAFNDLSCANAEWRVNIVVVMGSPTDASSYFGLFHVRFLPDGTLQSIKTLSATNGVWTKVGTGFSWREEWCDLLKTAYPSDYRQSCTSGRGLTE